MAEQIYCREQMYRQGVMREIASGFTAVAEARPNDVHWTRVGNWIGQFEAGFNRLKPMERRSRVAELVVQDLLVTALGGGSGVKSPLKQAMPRLGDRLEAGRHYFVRTPKKGNIDLVAKGRPGIPDRPITDVDVFLEKGGIPILVDVSIRDGDGGDFKRTLPWLWDENNRRRRLYEAFEDAFDYKRHDFVHAIVAHERRINPGRNPKVQPFLDQGGVLIPIPFGDKEQFGQIASQRLRMSL